MMPITIKCAWCGFVIGVKEGGPASAFSISHSICHACAATVRSALHHPSSEWNGTDRRTGADRRRCERRESARFVGDTIIMIKGIAWIDNDGTDRRRVVRREADRQMIVNFILENGFE